MYICHHHHNSIHSAVIIVVGNKHDSCQVCTSHSFNTRRRGMNPTIILPGMGKIAAQTGIFSLVVATSLREKKN